MTSVSQFTENKFKLSQDKPYIVVEDDEEFDTIFNYCKEKHLRTIIKFSAHWCRPCHKIQPIYEDLANAYLNKGIFIYVDIDKCDETANRFNVRTIPQFS